MLKTFEINLDVEKELYSPSSLLFTVSILDLDSVELLFTIEQDGANLDLTGKTLELAIRKPSGLSIYQLVEITEPTEGKARIRLDNQSYIEFGIYSAEIVIREGEQIAVTSPFYYSSRSAILDDESLESNNEWSIFHELLFGYDKKPIISDGFPSVAPEYIGQMAYDVLNNIAYISSGATWEPFATEGGGGSIVVDTIIGNGAPTVAPIRLGQIYIDETNRAAYISIGATVDDWDKIDNETPVIDWAEIINKPLTFPPDAHAHDWAEITGKPTTFAPDAHAHSFAEITDKPLTYPPDAHAHAIADVNGLQLALDGKADDADLDAKANKVDVYTKLETYTKNEVDNIVTESGGTVVTDSLTSTSTTNALSANQGRILNEKKAEKTHNHDGVYSAIDHAHAFADITNKPLTYPPDAHSHDFDAITNKPLTYPPSAHAHTFAEITDKPLTYPPDAHAHAFADITDKPLTYPPDAHTHAIAEVNGLQVALDGKADDADLDAKADAVHSHAWGEITAKPLTFPPDAHAHAWGEITEKPTTFTPSAHSHAFAEITDKPLTYPPDAHTHAWGEITAKPTTFTPEAHAHAIADVTNLQASLDAKADDADLTTKADAVHSHTEADVTFSGINSKSYVDNADNAILSKLNGLSLWKGTQTEYNAITTKDPNTLYFIT